MGIGYVIYAVEDSTLNANMPTTPAIEALFRIGAMPVMRKLQFVGPSPRIVRHPLSDLGISGVRTHAAWLVDVDENDPGGTLSALLPALHRELENNSRDWSIPSVQPYRQELHGPVSWWESGQAANTRSRDLPRGTISAMISSHENPIGPDPEDLASKARRAAVIVGGAALLGGTIWLGLKAVQWRREVNAGSRKRNAKNRELAARAG